MNPTAIYSKSGKGVQEASGKTSHLSRPDRAVLSAIDGRATLADVAQKVGKSFDPAFEKLIESLDKGGFIREVSAGTAAPAAKAGAKPAGKATGPMDVASDLDFTTIMTTPGARPAPPPQAPPRATPPPAKHTATIPPPPPPPSPAQKAQADKSAKEQQDAFAKAREEAERKAAAERERIKAEAEAKMRAETESKLRAEAEAKARADTEKRLAEEAESKVRAAREAAVKAAAEAKAKAEAEARKAREEAERARKEAEEKAERARQEAERARKEAEEKAERARKEAEEKAERARKEAEEKLRREQEELKRKLEEERKAREEAERKAKEEAKRLEEERRKLEEERKAAAEARRREDEERTLRRIQEERERVERKRQREEEEEEAEKAAKKAKRAKPVEEPEPEDEPEPVKAAPPPPTPPGGGFSDSLLADLASFSTQEEDDRKEKEEAERKAKEEAARKAREDEERRAKEDAERGEREAKARRKQEEAERKRREEEALREREEREKQRLKEEEEKRRLEAEERAKKAKQEESLAASATRVATPTYNEAAVLRGRREREMAARPSRGGARTQPRSWGKSIALVLLVLVVIGVGVAHVMPIETADYERGATEALGRPVKIRSANLSLVTGLMIKFKDVAVGDGTRIAEVRAYPEFGALLGPSKAFSRIEFDGVKLAQAAAGQALFARVKSDNFSVARIVARQLELVGPLAMPKGLEAEVLYNAEGTVRAATIRGPEALLVRMIPKGEAIDVDMSASSFSLPFAPQISLAKFGLKGSATPKGMSVSEWDGQALNGTISGTANVRWGDSWAVDGVLTARGINAAVFAPALLSDGRGEGSGKFAMRGSDPGKLGDSSRLDGSFTVTRGVLGSIDLSRAIQTGGKQATGRTEFSEMNGQATYERGSVALRNVTISAGKLNAGASAEISPKGALSGRIVADVTVSSQVLRATLSLGGTLKEPQVRN